MKQFFKPERNLLSVIVLLTILVYSNSLFNGFTNWDDELNVTANLSIRSMGFYNLKIFFTTPYVGMYVPLTMITYAFDYLIAGLNPIMFHLTNLLLHIINVVLVYKLIKLLTGTINVSAIAALLFAVHPVNVESIAWISTRSSLLFTLFYFASLIYYIRYLNHGEKNKHLVIALIFFVLSLLSKSQAMTLPVLLFAFDYWYKRKVCTKIFLEKIPFFAFAVVFGILTVFMREEAGHLNPTSMFSFLDKLCFTFYAFQMYLFKLIVPVNLSAFYPVPDKTDNFLPVEFFIAPIIILILIFFIWRWFRYNRNVIFGTLFFLITISIVTLKIIPFGHQIIAERYGYIPYIGIFMIAGSFYNRIAEQQKLNPKSYNKTLFTIILSAFILFFSITTFSRNFIWKNSITLYTDVILKNPDIALPYYNRGLAKVSMNDLKGAVEDFTAAIKSKHYKTNEVFRFYISRGNTFKLLNLPDKAMEDYNKGIEMNPDYAEAYYNRGNLKAKTKDFVGAMNDYKKAIVLNPEFHPAYTQLGTLKAMMNQMDEAMQYFNKALEIKPDFTEALLNRGIAEISLRDYKGAVRDFSKVTEINPSDAYAWFNKGIAELNLSMKDKACADIKKSLDLGYKEAESVLKQVCH